MAPSLKVEKSEKDHDKKWLLRLQMVLFECPSFKNPSVSFLFGLGEFPSIMRREQGQDAYVIEPKYCVSFCRCHMHLFGPSGTMQNLDGLCVLPLNILHDKVYLILWFWYLILLAVTLVQFAYWLRFLCSPTQRYIQGHV